MKNLTIILPYYMNPGMLAWQMQVINEYPEAIRKRIELIVVDDASPLGHRAEEAIKERRIEANGYPFKLFRILTDLRWNWLEARNLGAHHAENEWLLLTDIDHIITADVITRLFESEVSWKCFYTFARTRAVDMTPYHPHPNSYLMTKKMYWEIGGYDETFAGHYGTDGMWRRRCEEKGKHVFLEDFPLLLIQREIQPDASTTSLDRKQNRDPDALNHVRDFQTRNKLDVQVLRLPWKRII